METTTSFEWWNVDAPGRIFYEPYRTTLLDSSSDSLLSATGILLFDVTTGRSESIRIGPYWTLVHVWAAPQNRQQRIGPLAVARLPQRFLGLKDPVAYGGVVYHLEGPHRKGQFGFVAALTTSFAR